jgi:hypothetical protein
MESNAVVPRSVAFAAAQERLEQVIRDAETRAIARKVRGKQGLKEGISMELIQVFSL